MFGAGDERWMTRESLRLRFPRVSAIVHELEVSCIDAMPHDVARSLWLGMNGNVGCGW